MDATLINGDYELSKKNPLKINKIKKKPNEKKQPNKNHHTNKTFSELTSRANSK